MKPRCQQFFLALAAVLVASQAVLADGCGAPGGCCGDGCNRVGLLGLFRCCHGGCGEIYWNEWFSDPPDPCDPCDCHANFVGPVPCDRPIWHNGSRIFGSVANLHANACGMRCASGGGCCASGIGGYAANGSRYAAPAPGRYATDNVAPLPPARSEIAQDGAPQAPAAFQAQQARDVRWAAWPSNRQAPRR